MNLKYFQDPEDAKNFEPFPVLFERGSVAYEGNLAQVQSHQSRHIGDRAGVNGLFVEESHTNLLPSNQALQLTNPYTTGVLNGTYTLDIKGPTGSITLSGGATGTVTAGNSLTFTVSNATVTLTPTGNPEYNQLVNKAYPLSWVPGGTTKQADKCYIPSNELKKFYNPYDACIELIHNSPQNIGTTLPYVFANTTPTLSNGILLYYQIQGGNLTLTLWRNAILDRITLSSNNLKNLPVSLNLYKDNKQTLFCENNEITVSHSGFIPFNDFVFGNRLSDMARALNNHIKYFVFSEVRSKEDIERRQKFAEANGYFPVDDKVTAFLDLESGIRAYRRTNI